MSSTKMMTIFGRDAGSTHNACGGTEPSKRAQTKLEMREMRICMYRLEKVSSEKADVPF